MGSVRQILVKLHRNLTGGPVPIELRMVLDENAELADVRFYGLWMVNKKKSSLHFFNKREEKEYEEIMAIKKTKVLL